MPMYMIRSTLDRLSKRLEEIQKEKYNVARELQQAAAYGDFSENAEYDAAKEKKDMLANEEMKIRTWLGDAALIEEVHTPPELVTIGKKLLIEDVETGQQQAFVILGEMDQIEGQPVLAVTAPLAAGLLNKRKGRTVEVRLPRGVKRYKILELDGYFHP
jgi:transcription elongation factor GreA